jgi:rubrerythrin
MAKHLKLKVGNIVRKTNGELFGGHGESPYPTIKITKIGAWANGLYILNNLYVIDQEKLTVIEEDERSRVEKVWEESGEICVSLKPDLNTSCIREDNGEAKMKFSESNFRKALFRHRMRNPSGGYEAYKCSHCDHIHIGKTKNEIAPLHQTL